MMFGLNLFGGVVTFIIVAFLHRIYLNAGICFGRFLGLLKYLLGTTPSILFFIQVMTCGL